MEGLIGQGVRDALESLDHTVLGCDLRSLCETKKFDLRNADKLRSALAECDGVLHLGALSRVIWGEMHPALCHSINVGGRDHIDESHFRNASENMVNFCKFA